ncbi:MAG TPA: DUF429 domain-containing protein [Jiangellaceae bacterium]|nr:DUF429 domain-containing protein [Jiangellaceae bacterium]
MPEAKAGQSGVRAAGIDACKAGWVAIVVSEAGYESARVARSIGDLARELAVDVLAIDIPIGLPVDGSPREADHAARAGLGRRSGAVFSVPPRIVLETEPYRAADQRARDITGRGITVYTYGLRKKILEVDGWRDQEQRIVREVHPEVSFVVLAASLAMSAPTAGKKSQAGVAQRIELLRAGGVDVPVEIANAGGVGVDDVLDAAAAAWSGRRILIGQARSFPRVPPQDGRGRPVAIWA